LVAQVRASSLVIAAEEAHRLRLVADLADMVAVAAAVRIASVPRVPGAPQDHAVIDAAVDDELQAVLGISASPAARLVDLAKRLTSVLPQVLAALESGRLDLSRARVLADATEVLSDAAAREVADQMLAAAKDAPWQGLSPRGWRARAERTVVRVDADAARRRRREAYARRAVRSWPTSEGMAELSITASAADVAMAEQVLTDLANARPATGLDGEYVSMDQRRVDSLIDVFRRVRDGREMPGVPVRRERALGLVMHADTFFGAGPAAADPGEIRGLSGPSPVDAETAREQAHALAGTPATAGAAGTGATAGTVVSPSAAARPGAVNVLLVDWAGVLHRVLRLPKPPEGGWTRQLLHAAVAARLNSAPSLRRQSYAPTVAIAEHVRARNPRCVGYDCPRSAHRCDLDHDTPWPRGPTHVTNLGPRCRRQHEIKTRGLVKTSLHVDGSLDTTMLTGLVVTTRPEPLPGYAPGEGYGPDRAGEQATAGSSTA
jgi:Domain of unknown function (DUF222)